MNEQELKTAIEEVGKSIQAKLDAHNKAAAAASADEVKKMRDELKAEIEPQLKKKDELITKLQEQVDKLETESKRVQHPMGEVKAPTFQETIYKGLTQADKDHKAGGGLRKYFQSGKGASISWDLKADDMTQSNTLTGAVIQPDRVPGIVFDPDRRTRVRDLISQGTTTSSSVTYVYESAISDGSLLVAEGQEYGQTDVDLAVGTGTVRKITAYIISSEELVDDLPAFTSYINNRLSSKLKLKEDYQLLYGNGAGINLTGLTTGATAYSDNLADSKITRIDVLVDAMRQTRDDEYEPTFALIHPTDATLIKLAKDSNGQYIHPWIFMPNGQIVLDGVPVVQSTAITAGQFLVGDGQLGAQVFDRKQMSVEISYENEDNFVKGMLTIRISERITLCTYRAKCFIYGSFTAALAQGSA